MEVINPVHIMGRYGLHTFIPIKNPWEDQEEGKVELLIGESYYRLIGDNLDNPESVDLDGGPFMSIGSILLDHFTTEKYKIESFDCHGKYPVLKCSKLP